PTSGPHARGRESLRRLLWRKKRRRRRHGGSGGGQKRGYGLDCSCAPMGFKP
ncbi:hypothetical protein PIB30_067860, partial [Stylosanthes scabra]|nr:hypothetical protein [Stylosanthes scabra]